ncbi:MAG TPA: FAD-dependent oxidoreductase, partial [Anaerolineae bacterium]|nr:FAD-dependent oxidoreductase [Anaerolineae bacterium]
VGAVIVATGYRIHDANADAELGHGRYANVVTGLELERILSGPGPTCGQLRRPSDGRAPARVAFLQCVGSRDQTHAYCSSVCCMYALKEAMLVKDQAPGAQVEVFLMDMRTFNKGHIATLQQARDEYGVTLTHCRVSGLKEDPATRDVIVRYLGEDGALHEKPFDLVVLSTGLEPADGTAALLGTLGVAANEHGFCRVEPLAPWRTSRPGVYACGAAVEPQDIPESVTQASAAAAEAAQTLNPLRMKADSPQRHGERGGEGLETPLRPPRLCGASGSRFPGNGDGEELLQERDVSGEAPRIGVFVCHCGAEIDAALDVPGLVRAAQGLEGVVYATDLPYACLPSGRDAMATAVREQRLNRVVVAACSPRAYEGFFREAARQGGLNPYLVEVANIREQGAWAHPADPAGQARAEAAVRAGVARAALLQPLQAAQRPIVQQALVVGGGVAGLTAALALAGRGVGVTVVEREGELGGQARGMARTETGEDMGAYVTDLIARASAHRAIEVLLHSVLTKVSGEPGDWCAEVSTVGAAEPAQRRAGAIVLASGGREYRGSEHLLGQDARVLTQRDLEQVLTRDPASLAGQRVVMIQCVAPDERCSRVCCAQAVANARRLRALA